MLSAFIFVYSKSKNTGDPKITGIFITETKTRKSGSYK